MSVLQRLLIFYIIGIQWVVAQSIYQGPRPETIYSTEPDKAGWAAFSAQFTDDFDAAGQYVRLQKSELDAWEMHLFDARKAQLAFIASYSRAHQVSDSFKHYMETYIRWNYWHLLLAYPIIRANNQTNQTKVIALPTIMVEELNSLAINDETAMPAETYQNFLFYYVTYFNSKARNYTKYTQTDAESSLVDKASFARQHLTGKPYQYALARLLVEHCHQATPSAARQVLDNLSNTPEASAYVTLVNARCQAVLTRKDAPILSSSPKKKPINPNTYSFINQQGEAVTLDDYKGRVIYLDVWASWCGPCRAEFPFSKQLQDRLTKKQKEQIVFLYVSIDDSEEAWKKAMSTLALVGEQGWSTGGWRSRTVQYFGIQSIPRYILINKAGQVVDANAKRPSMTEAIMQDLLKLIEE